MKAFQIHPAPSANDVVMLAADWAREDRALQPRCAEWLAAAWAARGSLFLVPEFLWNRRRARRTGDRVGGHYLE